MPTPRPRRRLPAGPRPAAHRGGRPARSRAAPGRRQAARERRLPLAVAPDARPAGRSSNCSATSRPGIVLAVGSEVSHVREGDRVMVTWVIRDPDATRLPVAASLTLNDGSVAQSQNTFTWADHTIADEQYVVAMPADAPTDVTVDHRLRDHDRRRRRLPHRGRAARRERRRLWRRRRGPLRDHRRRGRRRGPDHRRRPERGEARLRPALRGDDRRQRLRGRPRRAHPRADRAARSVEAQRGAGQRASTTRSTASACARRWSRSCRRCAAA